MFTKQQVAVACSGVVLLLAQLPASAQTGKSTVDQLVSLFSTWSGGKVDTFLSEEAARKIDYAGMSQAALGNGRWESLSLADKREFISTLRVLIEQRYYPRWHKLFNRGSLTYLGEESARGEVIVKTQLGVGRKRDIVVWKLRPCNGELKVCDLYVDDKDLMNHLKNRFQRLIAKRGTRGLIAWMKNKVDDDDAVEVSGASTAVRTR